MAEPGPQPCLHISIAGSGLEMAPGPGQGDPRPELVPFDSDSDDESSPSPSGTLQSQASRSTISSSFGSKCPASGVRQGGLPRGGDSQLALMGEAGRVWVGKGRASVLGMAAQRAAGWARWAGAMAPRIQGAVGQAGS